MLTPENIDKEYNKNYYFCESFQSYAFHQNKVKCKKESKIDESNSNEKIHKGEKT